MRVYVFVLVSMFIFGLNEPAFAQKPFYYGRGGQKVFLDVSPDKLIIKLKDTSWRRFILS